MSTKVQQKLRLDCVETQRVCIAALLHQKTVNKIDRGESVRTLTLYRFKAAIQQLGWESRFPELFNKALGGAADPEPTMVLEPEDAEVEQGAVVAS